MATTLFLLALGSPDMEKNSSIIAQYHAFHDWYLCAISADMFEAVVELRLLFDNRKDRVRVVFRGATRCLVKDFLIQNIISSMTVLSDFESPQFKQARSALDNSYPWGEDGPPRLIASIDASIGADALIEFDSVEVYPEQ